MARGHLHVKKNITLILISMAAENQKADSVVRIIAVYTMATYRAMIIINYQYYIITIL